MSANTEISRVLKGMLRANDQIAPSHEKCHWSFVRFLCRHFLCAIRRSLFWGGMWPKIKISRMLRGLREANDQIKWHLWRMWNYPPDENNFWKFQFLGLLFSLILKSLVPKIVIQITKIIVLMLQIFWIQ